MLVTSRSSVITEQLTFQNMSPNIYSSYYFFFYIATFVAVWVVTVLFLRSHSFHNFQVILIALSSILRAFMVQYI